MKIKALLTFGIMLSIESSFAIRISANETYLNGLTCGQQISTIPNVTPVSMNSTMTMTLYEQSGDAMRLGSVESQYVNYIAWQNQLYGRVMATCGVEQVNDVLRFLQQTYGQPVTNARVRTTSWLTKDYVIEVTRFSYHLAQVEILCREMFFTIEMPEAQTENATHE